MRTPLLTALLVALAGCASPDPAPDAPVGGEDEGAAASPSTPTSATPSPASPTPPSRPVERADPNAPDLKLKSIGFRLDRYDAATNRAGDIAFFRENRGEHLIWEDFGIPDLRDPNAPDRRSPQPTFILPLGTPVRSLVDGVVIGVTPLYSGDWSVHVASRPGSPWIYENEHVINVTVNVGDRVVAGQPVAEVSTHDSQYHPGYGITEIGILHGGQVPEHVCPFQHLDASIRADVEADILALYAALEAYFGNSAMYDEAALASPGCVVHEPVEG